MNRKIHIFRFAVVLVGFSLWAAALLQAHQTVLTESFDDPALPGWEHLPNAVVVDGVLRIEPGNFAIHGGDWGDLTLTVRVRRYGDGALVVNYRASDAGVYHVLVAGDVLALQREACDVVSELTTSGPLSIPDGWFQLGVSVIGGEHAVTLDDELVLTATDPDPLPPGGIGFEVLYEAVGEFDDVVLTLGTGPPPAPSGDVPAYQALPWICTGGPIGGLGYDIRYNFADPNIWYVTDAFAGLHMSTDNGLTWFPSNRGITSRGAPAGDVIPIFSATVDLHDPNIVWIGTQNTGDIFKSTDRGYTWTEMDNGVDRSILPLSFRGFTVDPRTSDIVYAMGEIGSPGWTSDGADRMGRQFDMTQGIVYKTTNGGQNWTQIWRGGNLARYCWIDPRDPNVLYVSTGIFDREAADTDVEAGFAGGVGILKSTDGGQTWRILNQDNGLLDLYVGSLYMHPENPDVLLAAASQDAWSGYGDEFTGGVYLTEDGGENWERILAGELFSVVEYCDFDPNIVYAASAKAVYRSDDEGQTWQRFSRENDTWGPEGIIAGFPIDMQCDPSDPMRVFVNNYLGGNFLSEDGGQTWVSASKGYTGELVRQVVIAPGQPGTIYAGGRTGVFRSDDGGGTWVGLTYPPPEMGSIRFNEISGLAVDPTDANHLITAAHDLPTVLYSYDGGLSWDVVAQPGEPPVPNGPPAIIVFAPSDPVTVYVALASPECRDGTFTSSQECDSPGMGVYVSHDSGTTWSPVGGEQAVDTAVIALAVHPTDANTVYASMPTAGVFLTNDGGQTWTPSDAGLPSIPVISLAIDPSDPKVLFAGLAGGSVYKSTDGGLSWVQSSAGLDPNARITSIAIDPNSTQVVYVADFLSGVYVSTDSGEIWHAINEGLQHRAVNVLALSEDGMVLYAGVEGSGVYRLGTPTE